jgi:hypothetical protein
MASESGSILDRCRALDVNAVLALYADMLAEENHDASLPALVLRDKARAGEVDEEIIPLLVVALVDAPNLATFTHLAKALAAFGRKAQSGALYVVDRLQQIAVTNDRRFWVFDSGLWTLGYLGGEHARLFLEELAAEKNPRVLHSKSVYRGDLDDKARAAIFKRTVEEALAMIAKDDAGEWRDKKTEMGTTESKAEPSRIAPWMIR